MSLSPAPRHDLKQLVFELLVFVPYDLTEATFSIIDSAGNTKAEDATSAVPTPGLPARGGSLSDQVQSYLDARYGTFNFCDEDLMPEHFHGTVKRRYVRIYLHHGITDSLTVETHSLFPAEINDIAEKLVEAFNSKSSVKVVRDSSGISVTMSVPAAIFVGQNLDLAIQSVLAVAKEIHTKSRKRGLQP